jgi:hypothetical protein
MITNDSNPRTMPAIALEPTGNAQGTYKFLSLTTGQKIKRREWTEYPAVPDSVIKRVEQLAAQDGRYGNLSFANRNGDLFAWNDEVDAEYDQMLILISQESSQECCGSRVYPLLLMLSLTKMRSQEWLRGELLPMQAFLMTSQMNQF